MSVRQTIPVLIFFALLWIVDADAAIYKWKDENGKTHFTDDPTKVPEAFRKNPFVKGSISRRETPKSKEKRVQGEGDEPSEEKDPAEK